MRKNSQNNRRVLRFPIIGMVQLQQNGKSKEAYLVNISRDGIGLYTYKRVHTGQTYCIRPMSWNELDGPWVVKAVWCKAVGDCVMARFEFTLMTDEEFDRIKRAFQRIYQPAIPRLDAAIAVLS